MISPIMFGVMIAARNPSVTMYIMVRSSPDAAIAMNRGYIYLHTLAALSPNIYSACFQPYIQHAIRVENTNRNTEIATK